MFSLNPDICGSETSSSLFTSIAFILDLSFISFFSIFLSLRSSTISLTFSAGLIPYINTERIAIIPIEIITALTFPTSFTI